MAIGGVNPFARFIHPTPLTEVRDTRLSKKPWQVFLEFCTTKDFPKVFNYGIQWASRFTTVSPEVRNVGVFAGNVKNFMSFSRIPSSCTETASAVSNLWKKCWDKNATRSDRGAAFRLVIRKISDLSNDICDSIKLICGQLFSMKNMGRVDLVSAGFTAVGSAVNLADDSIKVANAKSANEKVLHGLSIGMDISYLIVGILGLVAFIISAPISIILVPLTTALVCSISSFFFRNIADPECKNRDPKEVLEALKWKLLPPPALPPAGVAAAIALA